MTSTFVAAPLVGLSANFPGEAPQFANLAGGGIVALTAKTGGTETVQLFSDAGVAVGAQIVFGNVAGTLDDNSFGALKLAALTGGGFVALTQDSTVHSGQSDLFARVYSAAGVLQTSFVVDSPAAGASEYAASVVGTADGGFQVFWTDSSSHNSDSFTGDHPVPKPGEQETLTRGLDVFVHSFAPVNGVWTSESAGDLQVNPSGFLTDTEDQSTDQWTQQSARLTNGNVVVAYAEQHLYPFVNGYFDQWGATDAISFNVLTPGGSAVVGRTLARFEADSDQYNYLESPSVSAAGDGFALVYDERDLPPNQPYYNGVHLQIHNADGSAASDDILVSPVNTNASYGKVTSLPSGYGVAVVYETENADNYLVTRDLYIETFDLSGKVITGPTLVTANLVRPGGVYYPQADYQIATRADGTVQVVWAERDPVSGNATLVSQDFTFTPHIDLDASTTAAIANVLRIDPTAAAYQPFDAVVARQSDAQAAATVVSAAISTTSVATLAYEFFTGHTPSTAGMDYLVSPTGPNANNLNSTYYQSFNIENRYINFAVNLGKFGEGATAFAQAYGSLSFYDAFKAAYGVIFGAVPTDQHIHDILDPTLTLNGQSFTRQQYFATYGGDGPDGIGTKAAAVGWLMSEAEKADLGTYAKSNDAFLTDVASGHASFGVDLVGAYAKPEYAFHA